MKSIKHCVYVREPVKANVVSEGVHGCVLAMKKGRYISYKATQLVPLTASHICIHNFSDLVWLIDLRVQLECGDSSHLKSEAVMLV